MSKAIENVSSCSDLLIMPCWKGLAINAHVLTAGLPQAKRLKSSTHANGTKHLMFNILWCYLLLTNGYISGLVYTQEMQGFKCNV